MSSGVVYARNTRCRGASNSRVMRICVSCGSVTTALLLVVAISVSFLLELLQHRVEARVAPLPRLLEPAHPVVDGLQRLAVDGVDPPAPLVADAHEADLAQYPQMLGYLRLRKAEVNDEVVHRPLIPGEGLEDLPPSRLRHRVERVRRGRRPCHGPSLYTHMG